jgi:hypothetical protein
MFNINNYDPPPWRIGNLPGYFRQSPLISQNCDIYQFGVFLGGSIVSLYQSCQVAPIEAPRIVGFDSFEGIPPELSEETWNFAWVASEKGDKNQTFHPERWIETTGIEDTREKVNNQIRAEINEDLNLQLIAGWFEESLTNSLKIEHNLKPAFYVDFDADIYTSTKTAFQWLVENHLIVPGTILGYDDWGGAPNDWKNKQELGGECRAHFEICDKYNIVGPMYEFEYYDDRQQRCIFVVEDIYVGEVP